MKKVKINGNIYTLVKKEYDYFNGGYIYYVAESSEPFNDLDDNVKEIKDEIN